MSDRVCEVVNAAASFKCSILEHFALKEWQRRTDREETITTAELQLINSSKYILYYIYNTYILWLSIVSDCRGCSFYTHHIQLLGWNFRMHLKCTFPFQRTCSIMQCLSTNMLMAKTLTAKITKTSVWSIKGPSDCSGSMYWTRSLHRAVRIQASWDQDDA